MSLSIEKLALALGEQEELPYVESISGIEFSA